MALEIEREMNTPNEPTVENKQGYLILIGGAEDKKGDKILLKRLLEVTQAKHIIIIPTASSYPHEVGRNYQEAFARLNITDVEVFDIRYPEEADREEHFAKLAKADLIFFGGGDQVKLVETFQNSKLFQTIKERFFAGTLSVAGTSAGAAAASNPMTFDGDYEEGFRKGRVCCMQGFGFVDNITIDTHFVPRGRISRLSQFLLTGKSTRGIGLDEDTGIIIYPDEKFEVIGTGIVTIINSDKITCSDYEHIEEGDLFCVNNLRIGFLAPGATFSIKKWSILNANNKKKIDEITEYFCN